MRIDEVAWHVVDTQLQLVAGRLGERSCQVRAQLVVLAQVCHVRVACLPLLPAHRVADPEAA
jgi:hypothetical protein